MHSFYRYFMWTMSLTAAASSLSALIMLTRTLFSHWKTPELLADNVKKIFLKPVILMCIGAVCAMISIFLYVGVLI